MLVHRTDQIAGDMLADFIATAVGINCPRSRIVPVRSTEGEDLVKTMIRTDRATGDAKVATFVRGAEHLVVKEYVPCWGQLSPRLHYFFWVYEA